MRKEMGYGAVVCFKLASRVWCGTQMSGVASSVRLFIAQVQLERFECVVGIHAVERCFGLLAEIIVDKVNQLWIQLGDGALLSRRLLSW